VRRARVVTLALVGLALAVVGASGLARTRAGLARTVTSVDDIPVELITPAAGAPGPWPGVVVVHGFSGSRPLMYGIAQTLARNGYAAAVVDLPGHGQNPARMSLPTGRSSGFDGPLARVTAWVRTQPGVDATRLGLVGHSMGAGAVLRFALRDEDIGATVAISTGLGPRGPVEPKSPRNVLTIAGAWEFPNVLDACRAAVTASYPQADTSERQGSWADGTARQCTVVPGVEHISVLFSGATATATVRWLDGALGAYPPDRLIVTAIPIIPALWLHAAGAVFFLVLAESFFPRSRTGASITAPLPALALGIMIAGAAAIAAVAMRFLPGGWIPLLTADYLCGFFAVAGLVIGAGVVRLGHPIVSPLPSLGVAWRTIALATAAIGTFALVAQVSWVNVQLVGARRWLVVAIFPIWLLYFLASDAMLRTRPAREYLAWSAGSAVLTIAVVVAAVFKLRAPSFLVLLAPALLPMLLWLGLYGHWLRARTSSAWPTACVAAALFAWLMAAVFPLV
jgi:dienelactone hydrolase